MGSDALKFEISGHVGVLTINRPDKHNAVDKKISIEKKHYIFTVKY